MNTQSEIAKISKDETEIYTMTVVGYTEAAAVDVDPPEYCRGKGDTENKKHQASHEGTASSKETQDQK